MKFLLGLGIGIALGTTVAPVSGKESRDWLRRNILDVLRSPKKKINELIESTREKAGDMGARAGRKAAESAVDAVENRVVG